MEIINTIAHLLQWQKDIRFSGKTIGFVPTMGFLHEGHLNLVRASEMKSDKTVVSIFVNPTQFLPHEDFNRYPRDMEGDIAKLDKEDVDVLFVPDAKDLYPRDYDTFVITEKLSQKLEGKTRPGHFRGVCTIVLKLTNLVNPHYLFMGQKDIQQCIVLQRMIRDLHLPVEMNIIPTVREINGLAMSSRNVFLSPEEKESAGILYQSLQFAKNLIRDKNTTTEQIIQKMTDLIQHEKGIQIDYIAIVEDMNLDPLEDIELPVIICLAAYLGKTRLIDNIWIQ